MRVKDIPGFEGLYVVTDQGDIISVFRKFHDKNERFTMRGSRVLSKKPTDNGYVQFWLRGMKRESRVELLHRLVAKAFVPPFDGEMVNHIDGNKLNNRADNLEWCTASANTLHNRLGKKLTATQIMEIKALEDELPCQAIAARYGVHKTVIYRILYNYQRDVKKRKGPLGV